MKSRLNINSGQKYGMLTVIRELDVLRLPSGQINRVFECQCDCGKLTSVRLVHLVRGRIRSCGCLHGDKSGESGLSHGLYNVWRGMKNRCKSNYFQKHLYSDKKITVCKEWSESYLRFKMWALDNGYVYGLQIDREDNSLGYYPANCRFVTPIENVNNRDNTIYVTYEGKKESLSLLLRRLNRHKDYATIRGRIHRGWDIERSLNTPIKVGRPFKEMVKL